MSKRLHVAVLGAGIMGSSIALFLARRGVRVSLFDAAQVPFAGASRWNEGKIHLGFLYAGDPSMRTAKRLVPGGLAFKGLVEELIGFSLDRATTPSDDIYLVHRNSVVRPAEMEHRFHAISDMLKELPEAVEYLTDVSRCRIGSLRARELELIADPRSIVAGFRTPERSVSTHWIADRYIEALNAESGIECALQVRITGVRPRQSGVLDGAWLLEAGSETHGPYNYVVNALWEGRPAVDSTIGVRPEAPWSHRFRLCLFVHTARLLDVPSAVIGTGPFGDIKNYNGRDFYLSWYPGGVVAEGNGLEPPSVPDLDDELRSRVQDSTFTHLGELIPSANAIASAAESVDVNGGWVFAVGDGSLADPLSTLHRRDRISVGRVGSYISVDTGKYSIAPWLAKGVVDDIIDN